MKALLFTLALVSPALAQAKTCECKIGNDEIAQRSYYEVRCKPASKEIEVMILPGHEPTSENFRVVGFDNPGSASDNLIYATIGLDISCRQ